MEELEALILDYKSEIKTLNNELKACRSVIDTYIYPEIANELLAKEGAVRQTEGLLKEDTLENNLITSTTDITKATKSGSNVIKGLFSILEE